MEKYKTKTLSEAEVRIRENMADAIRKDGEGKIIGGRNFYKETGQRLWEPITDSFRKSAATTKKCTDIYHMEATDSWKNS